MCEVILDLHREQYGCESAYILGPLATVHKYKEPTRPLKKGAFSNRNIKQSSITAEFQGY